MRRLTWFAIGAVTGIVAYRRGQELLADARRQGIVPAVTQAGASAIATASAARAIIAGESAPPPVAQLGAAAVSVVKGGVRTWTPQRSAAAS